VLGDRDQSLEDLRGRRWDAVIDYCGYFPRQVRKAAAEIEAGRYVFVSTISVYADFRVRGLTEESPVKQPPRWGERSTEMTPDSYGWLKVLCERALEEAMQDRALIVRPGVLVGPHDYTGRFNFWLAKVARGGLLLAPGPPDRPVQILDARDLADWLLNMVEREKTGTFNATGPGRPLSMGGLLRACRETLATDTTFTWVEEDIIANESPGLPLWTPTEKSGFDSIDSSRARAEGLVFRPLEDTILDTFDWMEADPDAPRKPTR